MEENSTRAEALEALMETWVAANPEQAADWSGSLPAGTFRDDALSSLMFHWAKANPADAAQWMTRTGVDDPEAASVLTGRWAGTDPAAAAAWASTLGNLESRRDATSAIAATWAETAPQAAADWAASLPPNERSAGIASVLANWANTAPASAAAWLSQVKFSSPDEHATALAALITPWSSQSPAAVSKYINTLPEGPAREAAASQFAVTAAGNAPAEALMWAMNLTDPVQRNQVTADACETWYNESPETFQTGIAEAIALMDDPAMRRAVYEMLYERDPGFQAKLLKLADQPAAASSPVPAPATPPPAPSQPISSQDPFASPAAGDPVEPAAN